MRIVRFCTLLALLLLAVPVFAQDTGDVPAGLVLDAGDVVAILVAVVSLVFGVVGFMRRYPNATPAQLDSEAARLLQERQQDRENMARLEAAYARQSDAYRTAFDTLAGFFRLIAPLTPIKTDDAASDLLTDIQTPGDVPTPPPDIQPE